MAYFVCFWLSLTFSRILILVALPHETGNFSRVSSPGRDTSLSTTGDSKFIKATVYETVVNEMAFNQKVFISECMPITMGVSKPKQGEQERSASPLTSTHTSPKWNRAFHCHFSKKRRLPTFISITEILSDIPHIINNHLFQLCLGYFTFMWISMSQGKYFESINCH